MVDVHTLFEEWHTKNYPVGVHFFGMSSTDQDRFDKYTNGVYKDYRVQDLFVAFSAGYLLQGSKKE